MNKLMSNGKHILAEFWHCQCDPQWLCSAEPLLTRLSAAVASVGLTQVGHSVHEFSAFTTGQSDEPVSPQTSGVTISLLLAESHCCLHTWGEQAAVTLDIYVCNVERDNSAKAEQLFDICREIFQPQDSHVQVVERQHLPPQPASQRDER